MHASVITLKKIAAICLVLAVLYFGKALFVPFFFALLISFILYPVCRWLESKKIPRSMAVTLSVLLAILPVAAIVFVLARQVSGISHNWTMISGKISGLLAVIPGMEKMNLGVEADFLRTSFFNNPGQLLRQVISSVSTAVQIAIIPFYVGLILYHRNRLVNFLLHLFPEDQSQQIREILHETVTTYYNFIKGMLIVYLLVGTLNSIGLFLLGIPNSFLYGFTASILTFIPYVGIIIGSIMPVTIAWTMHESLFYPLAVVAVFAFVQFLEANFIFPLAVSYRIKINTLATLVAIFAGAIIWGAAGMILFIPFAAILKLVAEKIERLKPLANVLDG
jgi:predicted PurR-regulated permease PerM